MEHICYLQIKRGNITIDDVPENKREAVQALLNADEQK
ncbi:CD1375 family protein [Aneurinibacillus aneurinilyticus]|nr:CD1375 family protein [Aneurinibacillus aneurinilyticus]